MVSLDSKFQILVILVLSLVSSSFGQRAGTCGNGVVEDGEECDCGTKQDCNICCSNCKFASRGTVCRDAVNSCDVPEYCNGKSDVCPVDLKTANGNSCDSNKGYCQEGECRTHSDQCKELWNGGPFKADDACYEVFNQRGDKHGFCNKRSDGTYSACSPKNAQCGKLWCIGISGITPKDRGYSYYQTTGTLNSRRITCRSVITYQARGLPELGTVLDGTKCGNGMVCQNNECVSLSVAYGGQRTCPNNCGGNGVCNENGNCHCNKGWKCPNCTERYDGPGGSSDSGLDCSPVTKPPCQCSYGSCCKNCQIVARGTVCRGAVNSCDVPEYCDGKSAVCPTDLKTINGLSCKNQQGYCYRGECRTRDEQCDNLWFGGAFKANDLCYETYNLRGDRHGYCKISSSGSYSACTSKNTHCGKLWCVGTGTISEKNFGFGTYSTDATLNRRRITCRSAIINQAPGKPALGTVLDGTKCGSEMVCQDNACVSLSAAYAEQPTCTNNCSGNGVCNENGHCHCNPGWRCPNCTEAYIGPGGSIDNGLSCQFPITTAATTTTTTTTESATKNDKMLLKIMIPSFVAFLCLWFLLVFGIYRCLRQRHSHENNNAHHKQARENNQFDSRRAAGEENISYVSNVGFYETPQGVMSAKYIHDVNRNGTQSGPQISGGQQPPTNMVLKENRGPAELQFPGTPVSQFRMPGTERRDQTFQ